MIIVSNGGFIEDHAETFRVESNIGTTVNEILYLRHRTPVEPRREVEFARACIEGPLKHLPIAKYHFTTGAEGNLREVDVRC